jgi:hypothetical protein
VAAANTDGYRNQNNWNNEEEDKFISIGILPFIFYATSIYFDKINNIIERNNFVYS